MLSWQRFLFRAVQLIECDRYGHLVSKAGAVISCKF